MRKSPVIGDQAEARAFVADDGTMIDLVVAIVEIPGAKASALVAEAALEYQRQLRCQWGCARACAILALTEAGRRALPEPDNSIGLHAETGRHAAGACRCDSSAVPAEDHGQCQTRGGAAVPPETDEFATSRGRMHRARLAPARHLPSRRPQAARWPARSGRTVGSKATSPPTTS